MDEIIIENENLARQVMFKLDKDENSFNLAELNKIKELVIDYNEESDSSFLFLKELSKFRKLESLTLRNGFIFNSNFSILLKLENMKSIVFDTCTFENADLIASLSVEELSLINCEINNYNFVYVMSKLNSLSIVNGSIDLEKINQLKDLIYLQISYSKIIGEKILKLDNLSELYIDNTDINDFNFLNNLFNLRRISIDEEQYKNNKKIFDKLEEKDILVLNENMVEFVGDEDAI